MTAITPETLMPAGQYYIGDLCYTELGADDAVWAQVCALSFTDSGRNGEVQALSDGRQFILLGTAHGDGTYPMRDAQGLTAAHLSVDAGSIGCILLSDIGGTQYERSDGFEATFTEDFMVSGTNGVMRFGEFEVDTTDYEANDNIAAKYIPVVPAAELARREAWQAQWRIDSRARSLATTGPDLPACRYCKELVDFPAGAPKPLRITCTECAIGFVVAEALPRLST